MTLTELRYIVAVARERHSPAARQKLASCRNPRCRWPSRSSRKNSTSSSSSAAATRREPGRVRHGHRGPGAERFEQAAAIKEIAKRGQDPLSGALRLGIIYTIGPYLLPQLVRHAIERTPQMPLMLQENFTVKLLDMLRTGELDCAIMAEPFPDSGLAIAPLYDEPFVVAVPRAHPLARETSITVGGALKQETMLLLGTGHCFRDHVLEVCPEFARFSSDAEGIRKSFEGSSLETIKHMVASGMGVTVVPRLSITHGMDDPQSHALVTYIPFEAPVPTRRVVLAWRRSFPRYEAIAALRRNCGLKRSALEGVTRLSGLAPFGRRRSPTRPARGPGRGRALLGSVVARCAAAAGRRGAARYGGHDPLPYRPRRLRALPQAPHAAASSAAPRASCTSSDPTTTRPIFSATRTATRRAWCGRGGMGAVGEEDESVHVELGAGRLGDAAPRRKTNGDADVIDTIFWSSDRARHDGLLPRRSPTWRDARSTPRWRPARAWSTCTRSRASTWRRCPATTASTGCAPAASR